MRYREVLTFPISVRRDAAQPLHEQIAEQIAAAIDSGAIRPGARIPSTRTLAELLGVSRGVAAESFEELFSRGYLESRPGSGTFVRLAGADAGAAPVPRRAKPAPPQRGVLDLRPGRLCGEAFPIRAWRAAWRHASYHMPEGDGPPTLGLARLRHAIAEHLNHTRGISAAQHDVVVTTGTQMGLSLIIAALGAKAAMERPISPALLRADACSIPVALQDLPPEVTTIVCCPDGNRPLGTVMSQARRREMHDWARAHGGMVVEVARDAVPRPRPAPLDPHTVIVGGFGELLTPSLKLGYALVPKAFTPRIAARIAEREGPPELTQLAVTHLLTSGAIARQTRRLGRLYAGKLAIVREVLGDLVTAAEPGAALLRTAEARRLPIVCRTLDEFGVAEPTPVIGFGHIPDKALRTGLEHLLRSLS